MHRFIYAEIFGQVLWLQRGLRTPMRAIEPRPPAAHVFDVQHGQGLGGHNRAQPAQPAGCGEGHWHWVGMRREQGHRRASARGSQCGIQPGPANRMNDAAIGQAQRVV